MFASKCGDQPESSEHDVASEDKSHPTQAKPTLTLFGMRLNQLQQESVISYGLGMCEELTRSYHLSLLKASIKALDCDVMEITSQANLSSSTSVHCYAFVRDPIVMLHDKKLIISTKGNERYGSLEMIDQIKQMTGYEHKLIPNTYFEGGNVFYIPSLKMMLHGLDPVGHYLQDEKSTLPRFYKAYHYKVDPYCTNQQLKETLSEYGIGVLGLDLNFDVMTHEKGETRRDYYYHLDCFMQILPDGRLIILNKHILSDDAVASLQKLFGDKFIDLAYPEYLTKPLIFNFIVAGGVIVSPTLPKSVSKRFTELNLPLITPESLDVLSDDYNEEYAKRVAKVLQAEGFVDANETNLSGHLARNIHGYYIDNGKHLDVETLNAMEKHAKCSYPLDEYYSKQKISFVYGGGGPHCRTIGITGANVSTASAALFSRPKLLTPPKSKSQQSQKNLNLSTR